MTSARARVLLARPDHLGDVLLTLPAVAALRRALPRAHISYLVASEAGAVPGLCPAVDETYTLSFPPPTAPPDPPGWAELVAREARAMRGRFDVALLPRLADPWSGALAMAAGIPIRLGYAHPYTRPFLTAALPMPEPRHVVVLALDLVTTAVEYLGAPGAGSTVGRARDVGAEARERSGLAPTACLAPTKAEEAEATAVLSSRATVVGTSPLVLHPGSGWPLKNWPARRWGELASALQRRYGVAPFVVGGPRERELVHSVVEASERRAAGLAGRLSLGGLAALHRRARLVIATDSGPLHLAAMAGAPVVGLYGPADPVEFGPWCPSSRQRVVRVQLPCSPCRTLVGPPCGATTEPACVTGIEVEAVLAAAADLLDAGEPAPLPSSRPAAPWSA